MARLCRALDWSRTSIGDVEEWPEALRLAVRMALEAPFPVSLWAGPDSILIYNDAYRDVLGAKHPRALGRSGRDVWKEIWLQIDPMFRQIAAGGPAVYQQDARFVMERTEGPPGEAWFTFSLSPIRDRDGRIIAYLNIATETTQRVLAERAEATARAVAERAEQQLRDVFAQAPAFMAVLRGPRHVFEFVNDAYRKLIGDRDVIGKPAAEALPEVVGQGFISILDNVLADNRPFVGRELEIALHRTPDAAPEARWVDFVYQPIAGADGTPVGIVAHGSDVTDAVNARRVIEESEARFRFLTNAIPVQVWTASPDGALDYVSDRTAAYFRRPVEDVIGDQWLSALHPDDVERTLARWKRSLDTGEPYEVEFRLLDASTGDYRWHLARATAQRGTDGTVIRWVGTNTDIEDRKQAEAELERLTREATEANAAKSAFLASMSHELRTPLNAIGGYAQLIEMGVRGPVTEEQKIDLRKIQRSKNHLDALVSDVLNFAKVQAGKVEYRLELLPVKPLVETVVEMVTPQLARKELLLDVSEVPADLAIRADGDRARQILLNLLGNAIKFTDPGGRIAVVVRQADSEAIIDVRDTGVGISQDEIDRIFEPFVQAKPIIGASEQGVGLGLAISRQLARAMRGDVTATSTPGVGSTFSLALPRR